jgi:hypothetical protein
MTIQKSYQLLLFKVNKVYLPAFRAWVRLGLNSIFIASKLYGLKIFILCTQMPFEKILTQKSFMQQVFNLTKKKSFY